MLGAGGGARALLRLRGWTQCFLHSSPAQPRLHLMRGGSLGPEHRVRAGDGAKVSEPPAASRQPGAYP